jgi:hypothetical protein
MNGHQSLQEIKANLDNLDTKFNEMKAVYADSPSPSSDITSQIWNICYDMVSSLRKYVYRVEDALYEHKKGHLPPILGAERMNRALEAVGLDGDYKAEPKEIYANSKYNVKAGKNSQFELDLITNRTK